MERSRTPSAARLLTATSPRGCCINDGPYAMTCGALLGVIPGDHDTGRWAVSPPDGFLGFVHRYFFRDGHWEDGSSSYESMALGPLYGCPEVLQGYSDPPEYKGDDRFDNLDLRSDPIRKKVYTAQLHILMPDGTAPPINDSVAEARFSPQHVETHSLWYPGETSRRLLARAYAGREQEGGEYALFRRDPAFSLEGVAPLDLSARSLVRPGLGLAILRAGEGAAGAALYLDYGPYCSGHGHPDKLNIIYYDDGAELIPDQGYLGARHEITPWNHATLCHNEVLMDGEPQGRADGKLLVFQPRGPIRTVVAEAAAVYKQATRYERSVSLVDHGPGRRYVVDVFRVAGGKTHDFAIHGAGKEFSAGDAARAKLEELGITTAAGAKWIREAAYRDTDGPARVSWSENGKGVCPDLMGQPGTRLLRLAAPGARHRRDPWEKREIRILVARRPGPANTFLSVLQPAGDGGPVFAVSEVPVRCERGDARAVCVTGAGFDDLVVVGEAASAEGVTTCGELSFRGELAFLSKLGGDTTACLLNGSELRAGAIQLASRPRIRGKVVSVDAAEDTLTVDAALPAGEALRGEQIIRDGVTDGAYEIESARPAPGGTVVKLADDPLLDVTPGRMFSISTFASVTRR